MDRININSHFSEKDIIKIKKDVYKISSYLEEEKDKYFTLKELIINKKNEKYFDTYSFKVEQILRKGKILYAKKEGMLKDITFYGDAILFKNLDLKINIKWIDKEFGIKRYIKFKINRKINGLNSKQAKLLIYLMENKNAEFTFNDLTEVMNRAEKNISLMLNLFWRFGLVSFRIKKNKETQTFDKLWKITKIGIKTVKKKDIFYDL